MTSKMTDLKLEIQGKRGNIDFFYFFFYNLLFRIH